MHRRPLAKNAFCKRPVTVGRKGELKATGKEQTSLSVTSSLFPDFWVVSTMTRSPSTTQLLVMYLHTSVVESSPLFSDQGFWTAPDYRARVRLRLPITAPCKKPQADALPRTVHKA